MRGRTRGEMVRHEKQLHERPKLVWADNSQETWDNGTWPGHVIGETP